MKERKFVIMEYHDLSISIVTYNNSKIIEKTVRSVINSIPEKYSYKLYIVDNDSNDETVNVVTKIEGNIEIIKLGINKGFGYGHNTLLEFLNSKFHFIINPDIEIENQDQIIKMVNYLEKNENVGMLSPLILNPDFSIQYLCKTNPSVFDMLIRRISPNLFKDKQDKYVMKETGYNRIMRVEYASGSFMVFRTDIFLKIKGFDENFFMYLEDADITRRVNQISNVFFYPEARVIHAWERSGHKSLKFALITIKSMIVYFNKWGWKFK